MNKHDFIQAFRPFRPPQVLAQLFDFDAHAQGRAYSYDFELCPTRSKALLSTCSSHPQFLRSMIPFGLSKNRQSGYALWTQAAQLSLDDAPVILFHARDGLHAIANNSRELLQLLALDAAPAVDAGGVSYQRRLPPAAPSEQSGSYRRWLEEHMEIRSVDTAAPIVDAAQWAHQRSFETWLRRYCRE